MTDRSWYRRLTSEGRAGLHVFGLGGPAFRVLERDHLRARGGGSEGLRFARLVDGEDVIDEVLVRRLDAGHELSIHGGIAVEARLRRLLQDLGFEERSQESALTIADRARRRLEEARTRRQLFYFARMSDGRLDLRLRQLAAVLDGCETQASRRWVREELRNLILRAPFGLAMTDPPVIVLSGPVNAGKSRLFNELVGEERVIVSDLPGTTRDAVEAFVDIDGFPFRLVDLAGDRKTEDPVERLGQELGRKRRLQASLVLQLRPAREALEAEGLRPDAARIDLASRADELQDRGLDDRLRALGYLPLSTTTGLGLEDLKRRIIARSPFGGMANEDLPAPFEAEQVARLREALRLLPEEPARAAALISRPGA